MTVKENLDKLENYLVSHKVKGTNRSLINIEECVEIIKSIHSIIPNSLDESEIIVRQKNLLLNKQKKKLVKKEFMLIQKLKKSEKMLKKNQKK